MPRILIATDADGVLEQVTSALAADGTSFVACRSGKDVVPAVLDRAPDLAVLDLQIGNMGAMAVTMALRLEESGDRLPHVKVLVLLDRRADLHLARRSGAEGWLVKPLDALRLRRAAKAILDGGTYTEGTASPPAPSASAAGGDAAHAAGDIAHAAGDAAPTEPESWAGATASSG